MTRITGTVHEDQHKFKTVSRRIILRVKNVSDKICRENQNAHFIFSGVFFGGGAIVPFMK